MFNIILKNAKNLKGIPEQTPDALKEAFYILEKHRWSESEQDAYFKANMDIMDDKNAIDTAHNKGMEKGKIEMAQKMKEDAEPMEKIEKYTGLSKEEIEKL